MATKSTKPATPAAPPRPATQQVSGGERESIYGFWNPAKGPLAGVLVKHVENDKSEFYLVRAWDSIPVIDKNSDRETAERGMLVGVSASAGLGQLERYLGHFVEITRGAEMRVNPKTKREFWPFTVQTSPKPLAQAELPAPYKDTENPL